MIVVRRGGNLEDLPAGNRAHASQADAMVRTVGRFAEQAGKAYRFIVMRRGLAVLLGEPPMRLILLSP
jgi:hypothetical protein